jgi:RNA polymerase sigma-70 factor (ECF subfamily)
MLSLTEVQAVPRKQISQARADEPIAELAALNPAAWQALFDEHFRKLHRFAYVRTGDTHLAEEIAAEVFLAAARGIKRYRTTGAPISAWLFRICRNITADHLKRRGRRPSVSLDAIEVPTGSWAPSVEDAADVARALTRLTRDQQDVIAMRFFSDCSLQETAQALGKSTGAVKLLQHRALVALRKHLGVDGRR